MRDDAVTVGVIAMCIATAAHEAMGHGGACLLAGGRISLLTSVYFRCAVESRLVSPAGPLGNLAAGIAGFAALRLLPGSWPRMKLFALLLTAFLLGIRLSHYLACDRHRRLCDCLARLSPRPECVLGHRRNCS